MNNTDTIVAIATATGAGGIGVVRVSGPASQHVAKAILGACPPPRQACYLDFKDADGWLIDKGIAIFYSAPHSYSGEDVLELQAHGGMVLLNSLLERCISLGARLAQPGEFTYRAYLNHKIDLAQAEAVADLINASTLEAARCATRSLCGEFSNKINYLSNRLMQIRVDIETALDFPEEELDWIPPAQLANNLQDTLQRLNTLFEQSKQGSVLREGVNVVLIGQPNVGKSSLFNCLAGEDVAIVTAIAGTTRDAVSRSIQIKGVPFHLIDTAGLHDSDDTVEQIGMAKTWQMIGNAHLILLLLDDQLGLGVPEQTILEKLPALTPRLWVHNKIDLSNTPARRQVQDNETHIYLSAKTGTGIDILTAFLLEQAGYRPSGGGVFMARTRHLEAMREVREHLLVALEQQHVPELLAEELRLAQNALGLVTGELGVDELLGEIFSKFCIGK